MTYTCFICDVTVEAPVEEECPQRGWSPYTNLRVHSWQNNDERLWYISVSGAGNKRQYVSGYSYGVTEGEAWSNFCYLYGANPRDYKHSYRKEITDLQQVIWKLKPENNIAYA
jgi:hypothetical protein